MAFNDIIDRPGAAALIPEEVSDVVLGKVPEMSAVMRLARRLPNMNRAQMRMPVLSSLPTAYFAAGDNALKQTTAMDWANKYIDAEILSCIVPIPKTVLDDVEYDVWGQVRPQLVEAIGKAIDEAVLYGTNAPASWTTNLGGAGILARCTTASHVISLAAYTDLYEALLGETAAGADGLLMLMEADGYMATGHIAHTSVKGQLRNCRDTNGQPIFKSGPNFQTVFATGELDGAPILYPLNGSISSASSLVISGQWNQLLYAMRSDISYEVSTQAIIQGPDGTIIYNLFQQDMIALKVNIRLGFALPNPLTRINETEATRCAFAVLTA